MLLGQSTTLPDGSRVHLRLPRHGDGPLLRDFARRFGIEADEVEIARALKFDPRTRVVIVADRWIDGQLVVVGCAAIERGDEDPSTLVVDHELAPGVGPLLLEALAERATRTRAA